MTTATKQGHTPGPWKLRQESLGGFIETKTGNPLFAVKPLSMEGRKDDHANARLIAAAPELLEALKAIEGRITKAANALYVSGKRSDLHAAFDGWKVDAQQARAAIARATGQGGGE